MTVITWGSYSPSSVPSKVPPWHFFLIIKCVHITESLWGGPKNQGRKPTQQPELPQPSKWLGRSSSQWTNTSSPGDTCCLWLGIWSLIVSTDCSAYLQVCHLAEETDRPLQRAGGQWDLNAQQVQGGCTEAAREWSLQCPLVLSQPQCKDFVFPNSSQNYIFNICKTLMNKCKCFLRAWLSGLGSLASGKRNLWNNNVCFDVASKWRSLWAKP